MKREVLFFILFIQATFGFGQNLVPNPSFEEYTECPSSPLELNILGAYPWTSFRGTPDFFHPCDETGVMSSPMSSIYGYGVPYHGEGKAGFIAAGWFFNREILAVPLTTPLVVGESYYISVQFLRTFGGNGHANCDCATNNMGVRFLNTEYSAFDQMPIDNFAHLAYEEVLVDSTNWTELSGWFEADSAYTYLAIGVFFDNDHIIVENYNNHQGNYKTYYFVDAVCVTTDPADCDEFRPVSVNEHSLEVKVFPNPATSLLTVESQKLIREYVVYDVAGRLVLSGGSLLNSPLIDVNSLSKGLYVLVLHFENEHPQSVSFLKQ